MFHRRAPACPVVRVRDSRNVPAVADKTRHHIFAEAAPAAHLQLPNLAGSTTTTGLTLDGPAAWSSGEDVMTRFVRYGWNVTRVADATDPTMLVRRAMKHFLKRPTANPHRGGQPHWLWIAKQARTPPMRTANLGRGGKSGGEEKLWLAEDAKFSSRTGVYNQSKKRRWARRGRRGCAAWMLNSRNTKKQFRNLPISCAGCSRGQLPDGWDNDLRSPCRCEGSATRDSSGKTFECAAKNIPWLVGGSADLAHSNKTNLPSTVREISTRTRSRRNLHFGVREHAMGRS